MEATIELVGSKSITELENLFDRGCKFVFTAVDGNMDALSYEVFPYSEDEDVALFISTDRCIVYEAVYDDLAALIEKEPINLSKFTVTHV